MYLRPCDGRVTRRASWLMSRAVEAQKALGLQVVLLCVHAAHPAWLVRRVRAVHRATVYDVRITPLSDYADIWRATDLREVYHHDAGSWSDARMDGGQLGARGVRRHPPRDLRGEPDLPHPHRICRDAKPTTSACAVDEPVRVSKQG